MEAQNARCVMAKIRIASGAKTSMVRVCGAAAPAKSRKRRPRAFNLGQFFYFRLSGRQQIWNQVFVLLDQELFLSRCQAKPSLKASVLQQYFRPIVG